MRMSPWSIPSDAWKQYEEKVQAAGMPVIHTPGAYVSFPLPFIFSFIIEYRDQIVDVVIHPRDLNLLFVAYGGTITILTG